MSQETHDRLDETPQPMPRATPIIEEESINLLAIWQQLRAGRRPILISGGAFMILAAVVALLIPNSYTASTSFLTPHSSSSGMSAVSSQLNMMGIAGLGGSIRTPGDMYVGILQSRTVAENMVARFDLKKVFRVKKESAAEKTLAVASIFDSGARDDLITISVTNRDPKLARDIAAGYLDELRSSIGRLALTESSQRRLFFEQQMTQEKDALENAEVDLRKTQEQSGLIAPAQQTIVEVQTIAATRAQIAGREVELAGLRQGSTEQDPAIIRLRSEIADLKGQLAQMESGSGNDHSSIPTSRVPALQLDYVRKQREVSYHETLFEILSRQYEAARLDESHDAPMLQVVDAPEIPDTKSSPHRTIIALCGLLFGVIAASAWVLMGKHVISLLRMGKLESH